MLFLVKLGGVLAILFGGETGIGCCLVYSTEVSLSKYSLISLFGLTFLDLGLDLLNLEGLNFFTLEGLILIFLAGNVYFFLILILPCILCF